MLARRTPDPVTKIPGSASAPAFGGRVQDIPQGALFFAEVDAAVRIHVRIHHWLSAVPSAISCTTFFVSLALMIGHTLVFDRVRQIRAEELKGLNWTATGFL
jgi:hypothetical protein